MKDCGNGQNDCTDYSTWQQKWTEITGLARPGHQASPGAKAVNQTARTRASAALFRRPRLRAGLLLSGPGAWFVLIYLAALLLLFLSAFWTVE